MFLVREKEEKLELYLVDYKTEKLKLLKELEDKKMLFNHQWHYHFMHDGPKLLVFDTKGQLVLDIPDKDVNDS